jgi:hypothetical protein
MRINYTFDIILIFLISLCPDEGREVGKWESKRSEK